MEQAAPAPPLASALYPTGLRHCPAVRAPGCPVNLHAAFDAVRDAASAHGIDVTHSEIIGLLPQRTIERGFADRIMPCDARDTVSIEQPVAATLPPDDLSPTAPAIASLDLPQASGTAAALTAILASATVRIAAAWEAVVRARRAPAGNPELLADRIRAVDGALIGGE